MSILFLDPLVLATYAVLGVAVWLVWVGRFRAWFGRDAGWTLLAWPVPLVTGLVPVLAGVVSGLLGRVGVVGEGGGTAMGVAYLGVYLVPWVWLVLAPPRWLLPPWARTRVTRPPPRDAAVVPEAVPALHAWRGRGHAARARWVWAVDAVAGFVWVEDGQLRFRAVDDGTAGSSAADQRIDLDDDAVDQLELTLGAEFRLQPPRGGWWTRQRVDVELDALDGWQVGMRRPWTDSGLLSLEVAGRRPVRLWVTDADAVETALAGAMGPASAR